MADPTAQRGFLASLRAGAVGILERAAAGLSVKTSEAQAPRALSQQYLRVGPQRPEGVSAILREADNGYLWRMCDLLEEQRHRDCHLQTVCSRRERAVADLPWQMIPASDRPRDLRVAAWVEDRLKALGNERASDHELRSLTDTVTHLNAAPIHGYAAAEAAWKRDGRYVVPIGALPMQPRRFVVSQLDASLRWYDVMGPQTAYPGKDLLREYPAGRFLVHTPRINGAVVSREGLVRPLIWASLFRTWAIQDWMKLAELAWKPNRIGGYSDGAGNEDIDDLEASLQQLTSNGWTTHNRDKTEIEIAYAKNRSAGDGALHGALASFLAGEMSKVTLGATLTVEEGNKGTARTAGVHQDVSFQVRDADARAIEATIQRQLIAPLVRYNFGDVPLPLFRFVTEEGADMLSLATTIEKMVNAGLDIPAKWLRAQLGIPEPDVGEELVGGRLRADPKAPPPPPPAAPTPTTEDEGPPVNEKAMERMLRVYWLDRVFREVAIRPANGNARVVERAA